MRQRLNKNIPSSVRCGTLKVQCFVLIMTENCNRHLSCLSLRQCDFYLELCKSLPLKFFLWVAGKTSKLEHYWVSTTLSKITLFRSELIISATSIQRSLKDVIIVQVPELFRILTGSVFLPARFHIVWRFSVFTVAVFVTMTTSSKNACSLCHWGSHGKLLVGFSVFLLFGKFRLGLSLTEKTKWKAAFLRDTITTANSLETLQNGLTPRNNKEY